MVENRKSHAICQTYTTKTPNTLPHHRIRGPKKQALKLNVNPSKQKKERLFYTERLALDMLILPRLG